TTSAAAWSTRSLGPRVDRSRQRASGSGHRPDARALDRRCGGSGDCPECAADLAHRRPGARTIRCLPTPPPRMSRNWHCDRKTAPEPGCRRKCRATRPPGVDPHSCPDPPGWLRIRASAFFLDVADGRAPEQVEAAAHQYLHLRFAERHSRTALERYRYRVMT